jgi:hypothetical protein
MTLWEELEFFAERNENEDFVIEVVKPVMSMYPVLEKIARFAPLFKNPDGPDVVLTRATKGGKGVTLVRKDFETVAHALGMDLTLCENCADEQGVWRGCWGFLCDPCLETIMANSIAEQEE